MLLPHFAAASAAEITIAAPTRVVGGEPVPTLALGVVLRGQRAAIVGQTEEPLERRTSLVDAALSAAR